MESNRAPSTPPAANRRTARLVGLIAVLLVGLVALVPASPAAAYDFKSDNDTNRGKDWPHVNLVATGPDSVTLEFVNPQPWLAFFEVRIDGVDVAVRDPHRVLGEGEVENPGECIDGLERFCGSDPLVETYSADSTVEVRHALGGESDAFFDWVIFESGPSKDDCKKGGWRDLGFRNQGQCIRFVNTGRDSR